MTTEKKKKKRELIIFPFLGLFAGEILGKFWSEVLVPGLTTTAICLAMIINSLLASSPPASFCLLLFVSFYKKFHHK